MPTKIILLNSAFVTERKDMVQNTEPHLRIGMATLAACLLEDGVNVSIFDPQLQKWTFDELIARILSEEPDYLGLPAYTEEIYDVEKISSEVKKANPGILTLVGGMQATALPKETMEEFPSIDICVVGEGETTIRRIVKGEELRIINGICFRDMSGEIVVNAPGDDYESLDGLPFPAWQLYDLNKYEQIMPIEPLRGCPYSCVFCFRALGRHVRYKTPERILDEIEYGITSYGFKRFAFKCGTFPLLKEHAMAVFSGIIKRCFNIKWIGSTRVDVLDEELIRAMKDSGCQDLSLGIESGDENVLKQCGKNTSPQKAEEVLRTLRKVGIRSVEMNFILGLPGETRESLSRTKEFAVKMSGFSSRVNFAILTAFPATDIYNMALEGHGGFHLKTKDWRDYGKQMGLTLTHPNFEENELVKYQRDFYLAYYLRSPWKIVKLFSVKRVIGFLKKFFI